MVTPYMGHQEWCCVSNDSLWWWHHTWATRSDAVDPVTVCDGDTLHGPPGVMLWIQWQFVMVTPYMGHQEWCCGSSDSLWWWHYTWATRSDAVDPVTVCDGDTLHGPPGVMLWTQWQFVMVTLHGPPGVMMWIQWQFVMVTPYMGHQEWCCGSSDSLWWWHLTWAIRSDAVDPVTVCDGDTIHGPSGVMMWIQWQFVMVTSYKGHQEWFCGSSDSLWWRHLTWATRSDAVDPVTVCDGDTLHGPPGVMLWIQWQFVMVTPYMGHQEWCYGSSGCLWWWHHTWATRSNAVDPVTVCDGDTLHGPLGVMLWIQWQFVMVTPYMGHSLWWWHHTWATRSDAVDWWWHLTWATRSDAVDPVTVCDGHTIHGPPGVMLWIQWQFVMVTPYMGHQKWCCDDSSVIFIKPIP